MNTWRNEWVNKATNEWVLWIKIDKVNSEWIIKQLMN